MFIICGCNSNKSSENWDKENTRNVDADNAAYLNAINDATKNIPVFIDSLKSQEKKKYVFYIKSKISDGKNVEHMWLIVDTFDGKKFSGILDNVPLNLKNVKLNDMLDIKLDRVEDWIIYKEDSIIAGNYLAKTIQ